MYDCFAYHLPTDRLPTFVLALGQKVEWTEEEACFQGLAQVGLNWVGHMPVGRLPGMTWHIVSSHSTSALLLQSAPLPSSSAPRKFVIGIAVLHLVWCLLQALAELYCVQSSVADAAGSEAGSSSSNEDEEHAQQQQLAAQRRRQLEWTVQHVILPALRWGRIEHDSTSLQFAQVVLCATHAVPFAP